MSHPRSEYEDFRKIAPDAYDVVAALGQVASKAALATKYMRRQAPNFPNRNCFISLPPSPR